MAGPTVSPRNGTTICTTRCTCSSPARPPAITPITPSPPPVSGARWRKASPIRASLRPFAAAGRAASLPPNCRRRLLSPFCRTTTRSAITPSARGSRRTRPRRRCMPPSRSSCCRRRSRCCSWARSGRAGGRSPSSAISSPGSPTPCATGGAANSPASRNSAMRPPARASPTRPRKRPSRCRGSTGASWNEPHALWLLVIGVARHPGARDRAAARRHAGLCQPLSGGCAIGVAVEWRLGDGSRLLLCQFRRPAVPAVEAKTRGRSIRRPAGRADQRRLLFARARRRVT